MTVIRNILQDVLKEELSVNLKMQDSCQREIVLLPKGTVITKTIRNHDYLYLLFRNEGKVKTEYLGAKEKTDTTELIKRLNKRKSYQKKLRSLITEEKEIRNMMKKVTNPSII